MLGVLCVHSHSEFDGFADLQIFEILNLHDLLPGGQFLGVLVYLMP